MALKHCNLLCNCPRASSGAGAGTSPSAGELAVDEGERSLAILGAVSLVGVGVVPIAAVRIRSVAIRLDFAGRGA
jgi:hypothetical protein